MTTRRYFNGVKTLGLFVLLWAVLIGLGSVIAGGSYLWIFALFGVISTFIGYWNSATLAIRAMHARPVTEVEQPTMYRIVRDLSRDANQPMPQLYVSPTAAPNAFATGRNPPTRPCAAPRESWNCSMSASCAGCSATNSCTCTTATF